jgi:hypothetical protein
MPLVTALRKLREEDLKFKASVGYIVRPFLSQKKKKKEKERKKEKSSVLVVHACNPSYSGGRDQEDQGSRPA